MGCDCWEPLDNIKQEIRSQGHNVAERLTGDEFENLDETFYGKTLQKADGKDDTAKHGAMGSLRFCNWAAPEWGPTGEFNWDDAFRAAALIIALANGVAQSQIADMQQDLAESY